MSSLSHTEIMTTRVASLLADAALAAERFGAAAGLSCRASCGRCCMRPGMHARVVEMQPAAAKLLRDGDAEGWFAAASADPDGRCVFFRRHSGAGDASGSCAHYDVRPGVCRLFGYAVQRDKYGKAELASCATIRLDRPEAVSSAERAIAAEALTGPEFRQLDAAILALEAGAGAEELLPINRALMAALTRLAYTES